MWYDHIGASHDNQIVLIIFRPVVVIALDAVRDIPARPRWELDGSSFSDQAFDGSGHVIPR